MEPDYSWDGDPEHELLSVTSMLLCGAPINQQTTMQKIIAYQLHCGHQKCAGYDVCEEVAGVSWS